ALKALEHAHPDIVLLDQMLPDIPGLDVLAKMKRNPDLKRLPVLMITADVQRDNVLRAARLGASDYIIKPIRPDTLKSKMNRVWNLVQLERRARVARGDASAVELTRRPGMSVFHLDGLMDKTMLSRFTQYATSEFLSRARKDEIALDLVGLVEMSEEGRNHLSSIFAHIMAAGRNPRVIAGRHYVTLLEMGLNPESQIFIMMEDLAKYLHAET
ncbi:MAG: response regulator, partial [Spirochaetia bacterium]|nr:response regulator [Spirochaetia bacterium]